MFFHLCQNPRFPRRMCLIFFSAEIQDGRQKWRENEFCEKLANRLSRCPVRKSFCLNCSICILRRNSRWLPKMVGKVILEKSPADSAVTLRVKIFVEIALSRTVSKINVFLYFMQKFKMATKNGGKENFGESHQ